MTPNVEQIIHNLIGSRFPVIIEKLPKRNLKATKRVYKIDTNAGFVRCSIFTVSACFFFKAFH